MGRRAQLRYKTIYYWKAYEWQILEQGNIFTWRLTVTWYGSNIVTPYCSHLKEIPYQFSLRLRRITAWNFTFGWIRYRARRETRDSSAVTLIKERLVLLFLYFSIISFGVFNNPIRVFFHTFLPLLEKQLRNWEIAKVVFLFSRHSPTSFPGSLLFTSLPGAWRGETLETRLVTDLLFSLIWSRRYGLARYIN